MTEPFSAMFHASKLSAVKSVEISIPESAESSITLLGPQDQLGVIKGTSLDGLRAQNTEMLNTLRATASSPESSGVEKLTVDDLNKLGDAYNDEVRQYSSAGEIQPTKALEWEKVSPSEYGEARRDWVINKGEYIKGWEEENGKPYPRYTEDYILDGKTIRREGDLFDAHHVRPLEFGGKNVADNLAPVHAKDHFDHKGIHRPDGPYSELARHFRNA